MNKKLSKQLTKMVSVDQRAVKKRQESGVVDKKVIGKNTREIKKIVTKYGWPTISIVGKEGAKNAWLLAQHADTDIKFQKRCLKLMTSIYEKDKKDINPMHIAFLTDRILANEKKPQIFGTQFYVNKKGKFTYWAIKDKKGLDKRRAKYGIEPLSEYVKAAKSFKPAPIKRLLNKKGQLD